VPYWGEDGEEDPSRDGTADAGEKNRGRGKKYSNCFCGLVSINMCGEALGERTEEETFGAGP
jgi:hypothetical protein